MSRTVTLRGGELVPDPSDDPSGDPSDDPSAGPVAQPVVRTCPGGPWLVRGADAVKTPDGTLHATTRPVVAVCACARTQRAPWCDGTHKVVRRAAGGPAGP